MLKQIKYHSERHTWIDCLKGFAILLVMWGHTQSATPLNTWVQTFHVSIFLLISGFLYAENKKTIDLFDKTLKKLIRPYILFSILAILINVFVAILLNSAIIKGIFVDIYKTVTLYGIHALWYLPSYALATYVMLKAGTRRKRKIIAGVCIIWSLLCSSIFGWLSQLNLGYYYTLVYYPIASITRAGMCAAIMAIGYDLFGLLRDVKKKTALIPLAILCLMISMYLSPYTKNSNFSTVQLGVHSVILYICAITGSVGFFLSLFEVGEAAYRFKILRWCGVNSLILLITHSTLKLHVISGWLVKKCGIFDVPFIGYIADGCGSLALIVIMEIPIVYVLTKTPLKKMIA